MNPHTYLRAFLAGSFVPILILPMLLTAFIVLRLVLQTPYPIERGLVFPMALVPVLWGLWNMFWEWSHGNTHFSIGMHGTFLPLLLLPAGIVVATHLGVLHLGVTHALWFESIRIPYGMITVGFAIALLLYYLLWKYVVGYLNRLLEVN